MLEYILFDEQTWLIFTDYLRKLDLEPETSVVENPDERPFCRR